MIENPEMPPKLNSNSLDSIDRRLHKAVHNINWDKEGRKLDNYYRSVWKNLPKTMSQTIRELVTIGFPDPQDSGRTHPQARAAEYGLVIGTRYGTELFDNKTLNMYYKRYEEEVGLLCEFYGQGAYDLDDTLRLGSKDFMDGYKPYMDDDLLLYSKEESALDTIYNRTYANAIGYSGSIALTLCISQEMRSLADIHSTGLEMIRDDLETLQFLTSNKAFRDVIAPLGE